MNWRTLGKFVMVVLGCCTPPFVVVGAVLFGGFTLPNLLLSLFFEGGVLLLLGGCLMSGRMSDYSARQYGGHPVAVRELRKDASERSKEEEQGVAFVVAGLIIFGVVLCLGFILPQI